MPPPDCHTYYQILLSHPLVKTWQRVCLTNYTSERQLNDEKEALGGNTGFASGGLTCKLGV